MSRRAVLRAAAAAGAGALAACAGSGPTESQPAPSAAGGTVEFWYAGLGQTFIEAYQAMAKSMTERNPTITVSVQGQQGFPDKVIVSFAGGSAPDSFNIQLIDALTFLPKGIYEPLDAPIKTHRYDLKALWPGLAEQYQYQGKQLVLWANITTTVTYYNADLFKQNDLPAPNDLAAQRRWTWDTALESARKLSREDRFGFWTLTTPQALQPWLWMNGGKGFDREENPTRVTMSLPESLAAMEWQHALRNRYRVAPTPNQIMELGTPQQQFYNGRLAMFTEQSNVEATERGVRGAANFRWDIAPLPAGPKGLFGFIGGQSIGVTTQAKAKEAALEWLFHVAGPSGQKELIKRQIGLPVIKSLIDSPEWKQAPSAPPHVNVVVDMLVRARPIARTNLWRPLATNAFNPYITKMNNGEVTAKEACAMIDDLGTKTIAAGG